MGRTAAPSTWHAWRRKKRTPHCDQVPIASGAAGFGPVPTALTPQPNARAASPEHPPHLLGSKRLGEHTAWGGAEDRRFPARARV